MLQALGTNSNMKISYFMFGGCCFMIIGAFYVAQMERIIYDDTYSYCATVYYSPKTGYRIEYWGQRNDYDRISAGCARACYKDQRSNNGWSFLEIETQSGYADKNQAVCAGIAEGSLTWFSIYAQWSNTIKAFCDRDDNTFRFCEWLRDIISINHQNILSLISAKEDQYHHQIQLFYEQLMGIEIGFKRGVQRARRDYEIPSIDFMLLNARVDIDDLKIYYDQFVNDGPSKMQLNKRVSRMIVKVLQPTEDEKPQLLIGHSSDGDYSTMLKVMKTYRFGFHNGPQLSSHLVANTDLTFSSYPASIASTDDFYHLSGKHSKVIVLGVRMKNVPLKRGIDLEGTILLSARVMAANRLAHNGHQWSRIMRRDPDLGAKQWLFIDERKIEFLYAVETTNDSITINDNEIASHESQSTDNIVWLIDQAYGSLHAEDVTKAFKIDGATWTIDGMPYFKQNQTINMTVNEKIHNIDDVDAFLRTRAHRGDLHEDRIPYGNTDIKLYSSNSHIIVQSGPVTSSVMQPFNWNDDYFKDIQHLEHPVYWNNQKTKVQFLWN